MKNVLKFLFSLVAWLIVAQAVADVAYKYHGISPVISVMSLLVITLMIVKLSRDRDNDGASPDLSKGEEVQRMETVNVVQWARIIIKHLFKDNAFLKMAVRADEYVVANTAVVIPNPGSVPTVIKNNNSFPMVAVQRADNVVMYPLNSYVTVPTFITLDELEAISYDKTESVYQDHFAIVVQTCADDQVINWGNGLPGASNVVYTTGPQTGLLDPGQTGLRNTVQFTDLKKLQALMNKANIPSNDRCALLESNMYDQLTTSLSATAYKDFSEYYDAKTGVMGKLFGFDIMTRSSVIQAATGLDGSGNLALNALGAALGATDNLGSLVWQKQSLELAMGNVHLFSRLNDPLYTGDINNVRIKAGGRVRRADNAGVYALMQGTQVGN